MHCLCTCGGSVNWCGHYQKEYGGRFLKKLKIELPCDLAIPLLGIHQAMKSLSVLVLERVNRYNPHKQILSGVLHSLYEYKRVLNLRIVLKRAWSSNWVLYPRGTKGADSLSISRFLMSICALCWLRKVRNSVPH